MPKYVFSLVVAVWLVVTPASVEAMSVDVHFSADEVQWVTEVWYENKLFWQIALCYEGAIPVSTNQARYRTLIVPEFADGFFKLQIR